MEITVQQIKALREKTGAGMSNCKSALIETNGNFDEAIAILRQKGLASAEKKLVRTAQEGIITSYIHTGSKLGVLLELNCETDFVARRSEFQVLAKNIAMQIAANQSVNYIATKDIPQEIWENEKKIELEKEDIKNKEEKIRENIIKGRIEKTLSNFTLLNQAYIRNPNITVEEYIKENVALLGENIQIKRFTKFIVGN
jgi:elongation factor Ts